MPLNKAAYLRHEIIDECLRNTMRQWSREDLLICVNERLREKYASDGIISPSTLRNDLVSMEVEYGAPIQVYKKGRKLYYRYEDENFSIKNLPVSSDDLARLNLAAEILKQIHGFPLSEEIAETVQKLEKKFKIPVKQRAAIAFDNPPPVKGSENLGDLYEAILSETVLKITYKPYIADKAEEKIIHPYFLKEYNNRWFLFGWNKNQQRIENLALDRMLSIRVCSDIFRPNNGFNFDNLIGVTDFGTPVQKVVLRFSKDRAPYIPTRKLHRSQKEWILADGCLKVELKVKINRELVALILGFGSDVVVEAPMQLATSIQQNLQQALSNYIIA